MLSLQKRTNLWRTVLSIAHFAFSAATDGGKPLTFPGVGFLLLSWEGDAEDFGCVLVFLLGLCMMCLEKQRERNRETGGGGGRDPQKQTGEKR